MLVTFGFIECCICSMHGKVLGECYIFPILNAKRVTSSEKDKAVKNKEKVFTKRKQDMNTKH